MKQILKKETELKGIFDSSQENRELKKQINLLKKNLSNKEEKLAERDKLITELGKIQWENEQKLQQVQITPKKD